MKVILTADVKSLGKKGEIVDVSDGYARNMLLPKKLGVEANAKNINDLKLQKANEDKVAKEILEQARALAADIAEKSITVSIKVGEGGKTFGSVSSKEIAEALSAQFGLNIAKTKLVLDEPIAGLDPRGRDELTEIINELHQDGVTMVIISHNMDDVARIAARALGRSVRPRAREWRKRNRELRRAVLPHRADDSGECW